jgi:hypothetical protein
MALRSHRVEGTYRPGSASVNRMSNVNDPRSTARHNHRGRQEEWGKRQSSASGSRRSGHYCGFKRLATTHNGASTKKAEYASVSGSPSPMHGTGGRGTYRRAPDYARDGCCCQAPRRLKMGRCRYVSARTEPETSGNGFSEKYVCVPKNAFGPGDRTSRNPFTATRFPYAWLRVAPIPRRHRPNACNLECDIYFMQPDR